MRRPAYALATIAVSLLGLAAGALAQRSMAAQPMQLEWLATLPDPFPDDGALVVRAAVASRPGNLDPAAVRVVGAGMRRVALEVEELAPGLFRVAPADGARLPIGRVRVIGVGREERTLNVEASAAPPPPAPVVRRAARARRQVPVSVRGGGGGLLPVERVELTFAALPAGVVGLAARWPDWQDGDGALYGAWARVAAGARARRVPLICSPEDGCGDVGGHIPRPGERGEVRFVDAAGRVSPPSRPFRVR